MPGSLVLVEGASDRTALVTIAGQLGHDLTGVDVVSLGGITNLRRHLTDLADGAVGRPVVLLHDAGASTYVDRTLARHDGEVACFVCDADLEDELVRALGIPRVLEVVASAGDLDAWNILLNQPHHRARPQAAVLRRFWGTTSGRKDKYAALLAAALDPGQVPAPLAGVIAELG